MRNHRWSLDEVKLVVENQHKGMKLKNLLGVSYGSMRTMLSGVKLYQQNKQEAREKYPSIAKKLDQLSSGNNHQIKLITDVETSEKIALAIEQDVESLKAHVADFIKVHVESIVKTRFQDYEQKIRVLEDENKRLRGSSIWSKLGSIGKFN